jgi:DNA-binding NtrC family response regulator
VIVCDYVMPGMLGTELLRKIRSEFRDIVPVLLTGHGSIDVAQCAVNDGGAFRLLSKPCHPEALARAIHEALELRVYRDRVRGLLHEIDATLPAWSMASDACGANADAVLFEVADEPVDLQQLAAELGEESAHEA